MLKENKRTLIITSVVTLLPMLIGIFLWKRLPDVMATHFGLNNEADGFSSKAFTVFGLPLFLLALQWFTAFVMSRDPKQQNISNKMFTLALWIIPVVSLYVAAMIYPYSLGYRPDFSFAGGMLLSLMLIILGNYLPKARQNYTMGIRIPWTLANEENWNRTHRLAGFLWMACGVVMLVLTLCRAVPFAVLIGVMILATLIPCVYSYWLHDKKNL